MNVIVPAALPPTSFTPVGFGVGAVVVAGVVDDVELEVLDVELEVLELDDEVDGVGAV